MDLVKEGKLKQTKELNGDIISIRKAGSGEARRKIGFNDLIGII